MVLPCGVPMYIDIENYLPEFPPRNPEHKERPSFKELCEKHLQEPASKSLYWNPADDALSQDVEVLGAPLEQAFNLHLDLQQRYIK